MDRPNADIHALDVHELLAEREHYLVSQIEKLRDHIARVQEKLSQRETELIQVHRAQIAAGDLNALNQHCAPDATAALRQFDELAIRTLAITIRETPPAALPIKGLLVRALIEGPSTGASPAELKEKIETVYGRKIEAGSIRPNLARLREDGIVMRTIPPKWALEPRAATVMGSAYARDPSPVVHDLGEPSPDFWNDPFIKAVQAAAWKEEADEATRATPEADKRSLKETTGQKR